MSSIYTVSEVEQAIITQFGKPVGDPVTTAGLKVKVPFIQDVNLIDKRVLEWDGNPSDMPTKDKLYVSVDLFARWRIVDPLQYFLRLHDERSAQSRLDDILGSETRNAVAKHELIEIIRTTKDRVPLRDALLTDAGRELDVGSLVPIQKGRKLVEQEIFAEAAEKVRVFGIELLDIRFKRINYNESVRPKIYDRMISERRQIAERFLSEGNGEAARIRGNRVRDLNKIQSEAYRQVEEIRGLADAKATEIYARAYNQSPEAVAFYEFTRTMQSYKSIIAENTTLVLSTDSDLFKFLKGMTPDSDVVPAPRSGRQPMRMPSADTGPTGCSRADATSATVPDRANFNVLTKTTLLRRGGGMVNSNAPAGPLRVNNVVTKKNDFPLHSKSERSGNGQPGQQTARYFSGAER